MPKSRSLHKLLSGLLVTLANVEASARPASKHTLAYATKQSTRTSINPKNVGFKPASMTATYTGSPVLAGNAFPPITVTGTFNSNAVPSLTATASVTVPGDVDSTNNSTTFTASVSAPLPTPLPTPTPTVTPAPLLSITNTLTGGSTFSVGQNVTYQLAVTILPTGGAENQPIVVSDVLR